jgi:hypothetical protein
MLAPLDARLSSDRCRRQHPMFSKPIDSRQPANGSGRDRVRGLPRVRLEPSGRRNPLGDIEHHAVKPEETIDA